MTRTAKPGKDIASATGEHMLRAGLLFLVVGLLAACDSGREPDLLNFKASQDGPDEFAILPTKPLQRPESFAALPVPTPGGSNLADPTPEADAYAALGGNAAVLARPSPDGGLMRYAGRFGVDPSIRAELAAADLAFRRDNDGRILERMFDVNIYYDRYEDYALDPTLEAERFRLAGIRTPAAPPAPEE